jgi:hypothetical protein
MHYVLLIHGNGEGYAALTPEQIDTMYKGHHAFMQGLRDAGVGLPYSAELADPSTAAVVRPSEGPDRLVTDGPYAETKEQLGGFYVIDVPDLETAVSWAKRIPVVPGDAIEVRPAKS